jgi:hypothetical protein
MFEPFGSGDPFLRTVLDESRARYPLILTIRVQPAINLVRLGLLLFAVKRRTPIVLTHPPRHYAAKSTNPL